MRNVGLVLAAALLGIASSTDYGHEVQQQPVPRAQPLTLQIVRIRQQYCWNGPGTLPQLRLNLQIGIRNSSASIVLLHLGGAFVQRIRVADTLRQLAVGDYQVDLAPDVIVAGAGAPTISDQDFVAIPSQRDRLFQPATVTLFLKNEELSSVRGRGLLAAGDYVASITLSSWPYSEGLSEVWAKRTSARGTLLTNPIESEPFPLKISANPVTIHCTD